MPWTRPTLRGVGPVAAPSNAPGKGGCLHSWKEIAGYLNHGVRTVQRWEETEGLPVHRHAHEKRDSVYAYPDELDGWWSQHQGSLQATKKLRVTPPPDSVASRSVRLPKWAIAAATLLIFVLVAVGIWRSWAARTLPVLPFVSRNWVLIADIENQTGDPVFDRSLLPLLMPAWSSLPTRMCYRDRELTPPYNGWASVTTLELTSSWGVRFASVRMSRA